MHFMNMRNNFGYVNHKIYYRKKNGKINKKIILIDKIHFYRLLWNIILCKFDENLNPLNLPGEVEKVSKMIVTKILIDKTYSQ